MTTKAFNADGTDFDFLIGKRIKEVVNKNDSYQLTTTDGEKITITVNEGCGGCANGWSDIDDLKVLEDIKDIYAEFPSILNEFGYTLDEEETR